MSRILIVAMAFTFSVIMLSPSYARDIYGNSSRGGFSNRSNDFFRGGNRSMDRQWDRKRDTFSKRDKYNRGSLNQNRWNQRNDGQRQKAWDHTKWRDQWKKQEDFTRKMDKQYQDTIKRNQSLMDGSRHKNAYSVYQRGYYSNGGNISNVRRR